MSMGRKLALSLAVMIMAVMLLIGAAYASTMITPAGLVTIEEEAFSGDTSITRVVIQEGTKQIKAKAFANSGIKELILPSSITYIDSSAFAGCGSIDVFAEVPSYSIERIYYLMTNGYMKGNLDMIRTIDEDGYVGGYMDAGKKLFISFTAPTAGTYSFYGISSVGTYLDI